MTKWKIKFLSRVIVTFHILHFLIKEKEKVYTAASAVADFLSWFKKRIRSIFICIVLSETVMTISKKLIHTFNFVFPGYKSFSSILSSLWSAFSANRFSWNCIFLPFFSLFILNHSFFLPFLTTNTPFWTFWAGNSRQVLFRHTTLTHNHTHTHQPWVCVCVRERDRGARDFQTSFFSLFFVGASLY